MKARFYKTLCASGVDKLDKQVAAHLEEKWELYGNPYGMDGVLYQAVVWTDSSELRRASAGNARKHGTDASFGGQLGDLPYNPR